MDDRREDDGRESRRINWSAVGVITAIAISILSWFGSGFSDYRNVNDRVLTLENQRVEDKARMERLEKSMERTENKIDRLHERPSK
jgi:cell division protein FtsB